MAKARKRFGQHFLEPAWVPKLVAAIAPAPADRVVEIGPGRGAITEPLAARVAALIAIEIDRDLAAALEARRLPNVRVLTDDVLRVDLPALARTFATLPGQSPIRVVGNLPYNISSPILFHLLNASKSRLFTDATLMLQKEVAERLIARPGTGDYGVLTLSAGIYADVEKRLELPPGAFRPPPQVRSAVVRLVFRPPPADVTQPDLLVAMVRSVFTQRRKTLGNALTPFASSRGWRAADALAAAAIDPARRPETLTLSEYARLAATLSAATPSRAAPFPNR